MYDTNERKFIKEIKSRANRDDWNSVSEYLLSGLAAKRNYNGALTPEIFYKNFYALGINSNQVDYELTPQKAIKKIVVARQKQHNVLLLTAHGGSGKSIFIHLLPQLFKEYNLPIDTDKTIVVDIDFEAYSSMNWWETFLAAFNNFITRDNKTREISNLNLFWKILEKHLKRCVRKNSVINLNDRKRTAINAIFNKVLNQIQNNKSICNNPPLIFTTDTLGTPERLNEELNTTIEAVFILFIFMLISKDIYCIYKDASCLPSIFDYSNLVNNYFINFDNIEVYDTMGVKKIQDIIKETLLLCHDELMNIDNTGCLYNYFRQFYTVVCAMRTSTFSLSSEILYDGQNTTEEYSAQHISISYNNFFQQAILKKFNYLKKLNLTKTALYKNIELIINFLFSKKTIQENEARLGKEEETIDSESNNLLKVFIEKNYVAFFNNDIRRAVVNLIRAFDCNDKSAIIKNLLRTNNTDDLNGARQIIFREVFNNVGRDVFAKFGFEQIPIKSRQEKYSVTRLILAYIKWHKIAFPQHQISLQEILAQALELHRYKETNYTVEHIADWIYTISNVVASKSHGISMINKDTNHYELISKKWSSLIKFDRNITKEGLYGAINQYFNVDKKDNIEIDEYNIQNIFVDLTPAGECAINYVSVQFEFFSCRLNATLLPLYCYTNFPESLQDLLDCLNDVYDSIDRYSRGMLTLCPCYYSKADSKYPSCCSYKNKFNGRNIITCGYFIRLQEVYSLLRQTIAYIDRYRLHTISKHTDKDIEINILENIKKYCELYDLTNNCSQFVDEQSVFDNSCLNTSNTILHNYFMRINNIYGNIIEDSCYYFSRTGTKNLLKLAIDTRLEYLGQVTDNEDAQQLKDRIFNVKQNKNSLEKLSLYELCERIDNLN